VTHTAVVVLSDPLHGGDEALGRLLNALFLTRTLDARGEPVSLVFQGAGARWPAEIVQPGHPAGEHYRAVQAKVHGVCGGCADAFGATERTEAAGIPLAREIDLPGTTGIIDLSRFLGAGDRIVIF
jgi:sulfur relay (sulfurtransferase) complex TusBCD TusD component (DsrE family)